MYKHCNTNKGLQPHMLLHTGQPLWKHCDCVCVCMPPSKYIPGPPLRWECHLRPSCVSAWAGALPGELGCCAWTCSVSRRPCTGRPTWNQQQLKWLPCHCHRSAQLRQAKATSLPYHIHMMSTCSEARSPFACRPTNTMWMSRWWSSYMPIV